MWALVLCSISVLGILALLVGKNWERRRGGVPGTAVRSAIDQKLVVLFRELQALPAIVGAFLRSVLKEAVFHISAAMLRVVQFAERKLIRIINLVKGRGEINTKKGSASFFLQNVSTYKEPQSTMES